MNAEIILNINDNDTSRYTLTRMLQHGDFQIVEADSGLSGLKQAFEQQPRVILLDIKLPDIDGFEVCRRLKADPRTTHIPIIHITAQGFGVDKKVKSLEDGADAYLTFPVDRIYLIAMVRSLVRLNQAEMDRESLLKRVLEDRIILQQERTLREKFIATLTHDLRNPLAAIKISAELAMRQYNNENYLVKQLTKIITSTLRADGMIQDLLDFNLVRPGKDLPIRLQESDLVLVAKDTIEGMTERFGERFALKAPSKITGATWDPEAMRRVLENLVQNAVKYGAQNKIITIELEQLAKQIRLSVHNWGNPILSPNLKGLFDFYSRSLDAKNSAEGGWGIGLAFVQGVVHAHHGVVQVQSSEIEGTIFTIEIPTEQ